MLSRITHCCLLACLLALLYADGDISDIAPRAFAQTAIPVASPQPTPLPQQQEPIKIYTEEVLLPVVATDSSGRFDPTLELNDLLVLEDGEPQTIRSVRRIPASVLLLLDTGGFKNPAMRTNTTRDLSVRLVSQLRAGDQVAAFQFGGKVELIQSWTADQSVAIHSLKTKLSSGRNGRFQNALAAASMQLTSAPPGNRHLVLVTDGGESLLDKDDLAAGMKQLYTAQATIHVISYTSLGRKAISVLPLDGNRDHRDFGMQHKLDTAVAPIFPDADKKLAEELKHKSTLRIIVEGSYPAGPNLDFPMWRHNRDQLKTLKQNELLLAWLAEESGGDIILPAAEEELSKLTDDLARVIDSQYVVTYRPKSGVALKSEADVRRIEVVSRRVGLHVQSRRSYVVTGAPEYSEKQNLLIRFVHR